MNKEQFLRELSNQLRKLPEEERKDILFDYEEHFQFGIEEGKTELEIIKGLGSPKVIAKELLAMYRFDEMKKIHRLQMLQELSWRRLDLVYLILLSC